MKNVSPTLPTLLLHNNANNKPPHAKNTRSPTIVSQRICKTSSKKSLTTDQSSLSFQSTEISSSTRRVSIKFIQETKDSQLVKLLKSSVGTSETDKPAGLLKTVGVKIGEKMESGNFLI